MSTVQCADIMDAHVAKTSTAEAISTDEMLCEIDEVVEALKHIEVPDEGICVSSLDVEALNPSLDIQICSKIVAQEIANGSLRFEGIDWVCATIYVALNMSQNQIRREGLEDVIPSRLRQQGKRPTVKT